MNDWMEWREGVRQRELLARWREDGHLDAAAWRRAQGLTDAGPGGAPWRGVLEQLSLWLAVVLLGAAVICFIAANWEALGRFARLFGVQALLIAASVTAWRLGLERVGGQAALLLAGLLLGGLLALVGQTYQTGADTWQLFAVWAALLLPWLLVAQSPAISLLWAAVVNVAVALLVDEWWRSDLGIQVSLGLLNALLAAAWLLAGRRLPSLAGDFGPRLLASASLLALTFAAMSDAFGWRSQGGFGLLAWLVVAVLAVVTAVRRRDLVLLSVCAASAMVVATSLLGRLLLDALDMGAFGLLLLTIAVLVQLAVLSDRLRRIWLEWTHERG